MRGPVGRRQVPSRGAAHGQSPSVASFRPGGFVSPGAYAGAMPPLRGCVEAGCQEYTTGSRCDRHQAIHDAQRRANPALTGARGTTAAWRCVRARSLELHGHRCAKCGLRQNARRRLEVHHKDGDPSNDAQDNLEPLCDPCHKPVTRRQLLERRQQAAQRIVSRTRR